MTSVKSPKTVWFLLLTGGAILLYVGLLSTQYDLNGITEVRGIEQGGVALFTPNHLLYRPLVWVIYQALLGSGYRGLALLPAQVTTALLAALGVGLFYLLVRRFVTQELIAVVATIGFGTSWAYWTFSTDVFYITPASTLMLGGVLLLIVATTTRLQVFLTTILLIMAGAMCALAILFWQANIFLIPIAMLVIVGRYKRNTPGLLRASILFLTVAIGITGLVYFLAGLFVVRHSAAESFLGWILGYGGVRLPMWGQWNVQRIPIAMQSFVASIIPVWEGLGLRALLRGNLQSEKFVRQMALGALGFLIIFPIFVQWRQRNLSKEKLILLGYLAISFGFYLIFIIWWDPFEPKWFVAPSVCFWIAIALLWDSISDRVNHQVYFMTMVLIIAVANFNATIWPHYSTPNTGLVRANCIARNMNEQDVFIAMEWGWPGYISYFYHKNIYSLIAILGDDGKQNNVLSIVNQITDGVHLKEGKAYLVDPDYYPPEHINWLTEQVGLTQDHIKHFQLSPSFICNGLQIQELVSIK